MKKGKELTKALEKQGFRYLQEGLQSNIAYQADKASDLFERFIELVEQREIPDVTIKRATIDDEKFAIFSKKIENGVFAQIAFSANEYGKDLQMNLFFAHQDLKSLSKQQTWGMVLTIIGIFFFWTFVGLLPVFIGIPMLIGAKNQFKEDYVVDRDAFYRTIFEILSYACDEAEVDFDAVVPDMSK